MNRLKIFKLGWVFAGIFFLAVSADAANYYVHSEAGNDNNNGLGEAAAWKSMEKVNTHIFQSQSGCPL